MKIPGAYDHLKMVSIQWTNFQKNQCTLLTEHEWTKTFPQTGTNRQTDRQTERRTG